MREIKDKYNFQRWFLGKIEARDFSYYQKKVDIEFFYQIK